MKESINQSINQSINNVQFYFRERSEVLDLLNILSLQLKPVPDTESDYQEIFMDNEKQNFIRTTLCGLQTLLCCRSRVAYL